MNGYTIKYLLKEGGRNILSNKLMSLASAGVLTACFLLIGLAVILSLNVNNMVEYVENQNEIVVFLKDDVTEEQTAAIEQAFHDMDNIGDIEYISKEQALEQEKADAEEYSDVFDGLENDNPLPDKYVLQMLDLSQLQKTVEAVQNIDGVQKVLAQTDVARILISMKKVMNTGGTVIILILVAVSVAIISNTIKLTVFNRRKEINIMKYVGATDAFIRLPFLVEGMLIGLSAAICSFALVGISYNYILSWLTDKYSSQLGLVLDNAVVFGQFGLWLFVGFALIGILIGTIGSSVFVRRYLNV